VRGVCTHFGEEKCAVGCADRGRGEHIPDTGIEYAPVAPGAEAGKVGFQERGPKHTADERLLMGKQDTAIPKRGLCLLQAHKMCVDMGATVVGDRPLLRAEEKFEPLDADDLRRHARRSAVNIRVGLTISSCAVTSWISRMPFSAVRASTQKMAEAD